MAHAHHARPASDAAKAFIILVLTIIIIAIMLILQRTTSNPAQRNLDITYDYPIAEDLSTMTEQSDFIVIGQYTAKLGTWNMARDPNDLSKESSEESVTGQLYRFEIDTVLKGNVNSRQIQINLRRSERMTHTESNAVTNREGIILKPATQETTTTFTVDDPLFIEPLLSQETMLFLNYDERTGYHYPAVEPFTIMKDERGNAQMRSNLIGSAPTLSKTVTLNGGGTATVRIRLDADVPIHDVISSRPFADVMDDIRDS